MTPKQRWLINQALKSHKAIDKNLESWLTDVEASYRRILDKLVEDLIDNVDSDKEFYIQNARQIQLITEAQTRLIQLGATVSPELSKQLKEYEKLSYEHMADVISKARKKAGLPIYSLDFLAGFDYGDYIFESSMNKNGIKLGNRLNKALEESISKGWNLQRTQKKIRDIADMTVYEAKRIARTETGRVATEGNIKAFKDYGVEKVEWNATLEKRTCQRCASLHGKKYTMGTQPPLPLHPHCRCVLIPVLNY